jgi:AAA15 family ATPase/GTPase
MNDLSHFTSLKFKNFKLFKDYSVSLKDFNILVGPNNSGKSTILGAFRILAEAMRKAMARKAAIVQAPEGEAWGYSIELTKIPIATENVFSDYDDSKPASINFRISNGNELLLFFPKRDICSLICNSKSCFVDSPSKFKREYNTPIGFVPILGPVEHNEQLYEKEAARLAMLTHRASRNFRNIWYHYPEDFDEFKEKIRSTWPGMDIERPEVNYDRDKPTLYMFCPEVRIPREIFWSGFGFQVWCQMLTYIIRSRNSSLLLIDEPDIYLHSDLQRQLLGILKDLGPDILIATHSTEIITEADPDDLLVVSKNFKSAKRIKDPNRLQIVFQVLGSNLNPTLTQLAKSKKALFVEGKDFLIFSRFARKLNKNQVANRSDFAVIPIEGFNPQKVKNAAMGMEMALGTKITRGVIFDRDYRSDSKVKEVLTELKKHCHLAHILSRKEVENFLLEADPILQAIQKRISEYNKRTQKTLVFDEDVSILLSNLTCSLKSKTQALYLSNRMRFEKEQHSNRDDSTIAEEIISEFDTLWENLNTRLSIVPGKQIFSLLNTYLQENYHITISSAFVIENFRVAEIPEEMVKLIEEIDSWRNEVS